MKTPFIPTAMRCTQEQFEAIKPKLIERGCFIVDQDCQFDRFYNCLTNELNGIEKNIGSTAILYNVKRKIYKEFNEEIFLRNLGGEDMEAETTETIKESIVDIVRKLEQENTALKSTNIGLQAIVNTQKLTIDKCFKSIELKDIVIDRLQSRLSELNQPVGRPETSERPSLLERILNRII